MKRRWRWSLAVAMATAIAAATALVSAAPANAVIGGAEANWGNYGYFVKIRSENSHGVTTCDGVLIEQTSVLTAAHCTAGYAASDMTLSYANGLGERAASVVVHPLYDGDAHNGYDLAILHVPGNNTAGLPTAETGSAWNASAYAPGTAVTLMGTGTTNSGQDSDGRFRTVETTIRSDDDMDDVFNRWFWWDYWIEHLMIGAGGSARTVCYGDSGSPMMAKVNGRDVLVGIASFVWPDCHEAAAYMELSGPQLAWVAQVAPAVKNQWACQDAHGNWGVPNAFYTTGFSNPAERDSQYYWYIWCGIKPPPPPPPAPPAPPKPPAPPQPPAPNPAPGCPGGAIKCN